MKFRSKSKTALSGARALLLTDPRSFRTGFVALFLSMIAGLVAGILLGSISSILLEFPGLIVLAPAAIGLRGNVFGALASRLSTMMQLGEVNFSRRLSTQVGQNLLSSVVLSIFCSFVLAVVAKIVVSAFGINNAISLSEFIVISVLGGLLPTFIVMIVTILLARACVKRSWDLDNVGAPIITATGDMLTIPSLLLATFFISSKITTSALAVLFTVISILLVFYALYVNKSYLKTIVKESLTILTIGGTISIFAGLTVQSQLVSLDTFPILLVLVPPLFSINGAIASILSSRVATKLHLGTIRADKFAFSPVKQDVVIAYLLAAPIFLLLGLITTLYGVIGHLDGPGWYYVIIVAFVSGLIATSISNIAGYSSAVLTYRFGLDPDNFAVPTVTSLSDLIGAIVLMSTIGVLIL